jgi:hypothetical protein
MIARSCIVPIVIQSLAKDELAWRHEASRPNLLTASITARAKAHLTGRIYRLVDQDGIVLERVHA